MMGRGGLDGLLSLLTFFTVCKGADELVCELSIVTENYGKKIYLINLLPNP